MNVLSLCTGIGGLDLGLESVGFRAVGMVEIDAFCRRVLDAHWPEVPKHDDIRTAVTWWRDGTSRPAVDVVAGGFPCQPHSVAGERRGIEDERWLWEPFRDVIAATGPPYVIVENVPNLLRTGLIDVLGDLAVLGFDVVWSRFPAAALGAPHLRWRLAVIAAHPDRVPVRLEPWWRGWARRSITAVAGFDGTQWAVAHPDGATWGRQTRDAEPGTGGEPLPAGAAEPGRRGGALAYADRAGLDAGRGLGWSGPPFVGDGGGSVESGLGRGATRIPAGLDERLILPGWTPSWENDIPRTARGVPDKEARLHALGNAVVPAWGAFIGSIVMAHADACREHAA